MWTSFLTLGLFLGGPWSWARAYALSHPTMMTIFTSAIIFYGGYHDSKRNNKKATTKAWGIWGMAILGFYSTSLVTTEIG
jgi:hypothetical protein